MNGNISQMLVIAVMGIFMVFAVLSILWAVIEIMHFFVTLAEKTKEKKNNKTEVAVPAPEVTADTQEEDDDELIAVLTAAVAASLNTSTYNLKIKSFRRVAQTAPAWNAVSRKEQLESNLY